jgi:hypothetical protein
MPADKVEDDACFLTNFSSDNCHFLGLIAARKKLCFTLSTTS